VLYTLDMPNGICEHCEGAFVMRVDLAVNMGRGSMGAREEGSCATYLAILRWTKMKPGGEAVTTLSGTRESEHPSQRILWACGMTMQRD
jgi:hypothetical protein